MPRQRYASAFTARFSKPLASRRQRPSQANVLSTIQRLGKGMKPETSPCSDDLQPPAADPGYRGCREVALIGPIGEDHRDEREQPAGGAQERHGPVPVLDIGRMDHGAQQQTERVDERMWRFLPLAFLPAS